MADLQWVLDLVLAGLLVATLFHALRLERALGVLKQDRSALDEMLASFNASTRDAGAGIDRLRQMTETAGRQIARQTELGSVLKDDLAFLIERGDRLADRMDGLIRTARPIAAEPARPIHFETAERPSQGGPPAPADRPGERPGERPAQAEPPRMRSQAERDLLNALRAPK